MRNEKRVPLTVQALLREMRHWPVGYFSLAELVYSEEAEKAGLANLPTPRELGLLRRFTEQILNPLRIAWSGPIMVKSGFRDPALNRLVGGVDTSDHRFQMGGAADLRPVDGSETAVEEFYWFVARLAAGGQTNDERRRMNDESRIEFDQLILYLNRVHLGWRPGRNRFELRKYDPDNPQTKWPIMERMKDEG